MGNEHLRFEGPSGRLHQPRRDSFKARRDLRARIAARKREQQRRNLANRKPAVAPVLHQRLNVKGVHVMSSFTPPRDHAVLLDGAEQRQRRAVSDPDRIGDLAQGGTWMLDHFNQYESVVAEKAPWSAQIFTRRGY